MEFGSVGVRWIETLTSTPSRVVRVGAHPTDGFHDPTGTILQVVNVFPWLSVIVTVTVNACAAMKMCETLLPEAVVPSPKSQLNAEALVPFMGPAVKLTIFPI